MRLIADTSGILAAIDTADPRHEACHAALTQAAVAVITPLVIAEVHYLLCRRGHTEAATDFLTDVASGFYRLTDPTPEDYHAAGELIVKYDGQMRRERRQPGSLDLADAMNVVAGRRWNVHVILTLDADYRSVRPLSSHPAFVLAPCDLPV